LVRTRNAEAKTIMIADNCEVTIHFYQSMEHVLWLLKLTFQSVLWATFSTWRGDKRLNSTVEPWVHCSIPFWASRWQPAALCAFQSGSRCNMYIYKFKLIQLNPSSRTMALGSTQPLTEMSTRNLPGGKKRPARRADSLAAIYEPNV
jgi:hypothetical protein